MTNFQRNAQKILIIIFSLVFILSNTCLANGYQIIPRDKAKIFRTVGETVYTACKKNGSLNTTCLIDCGNNVRFQTTNGFCTYLETGIFRLNISTVGETVNPFHTATVTVIDGTVDKRANKRKQPVSLRKNRVPHINRHNEINKNTRTHNNVSNNIIRKNITFEDEITLNIHTQMTITVDLPLEPAQPNALPFPDHLLNDIPSNLVQEQNQISNKIIALDKIETIHVNSIPSTNQSFDGNASGNNQSYGFQFR